MSDYYGDLGLNEKASNDEIKSSFRKLSLKYHPDKNGGNDTMFKKINEAYQTLGDKEKRNVYDMQKNIYP